MPKTLSPPFAECPSTSEPINALHGYAVLDAFGLRIGSVCSFDPGIDSRPDHFCVETTLAGLVRRRHLIPVAYVTNVNQSSRFLQLSRLKHESFASLVPDVTDSFPDPEIDPATNDPAPEKQ